jgi:hypothetical protein
MVTSALPVVATAIVPPNRDVFLRTLIRELADTLCEPRRKVFLSVQKHSFEEASIWTWIIRS